jgi:hypothetical protein
MILALANAAITPEGMALGGWRTGRRRKERVSSCGSVWGRIAPPPDKVFDGGGYFGPSKTMMVTATGGLKRALDALRRWIDGRRYPRARSQLARQRISSGPSSRAPWKGRQDPQEPGRPIGDGGSRQPSPNPLSTTRMFERHIVNVKPSGRLGLVGRRCVQ